MDFFKSVFSDNDSDASLTTTASSSSSSTPSINAGSGGWGFGGLIKTITTKSESVLETYKRDLAEFSSGLKRETEALRDSAARAAQDLPSSAHSLADLVSHSKDALLAAAAQTSDPDNHSESEPGSASTNTTGRRYSRFEAQLLSIQSDPNSFASDPEESEEYERWREGFRVEEKEEEIEALCYESDVLEGMVERLVPETVEYGTFWCRYFYRVERLKKAEDARAKIVKRVMEEEEEDLSWDVDDDDDDDDDEEEEEEEENGEVIGKNEQELKDEEESEKKLEEIQDNVEQESEKKQEEIMTESKVEKDEEDSMTVHKVETLELEHEELSKEEPSENDGKQNGEGLKSKAEDAVTAVDEVGKREAGESSKDSDYSMVPSQPPPVPEEEDLEWDEIEDLGEHDDKKFTTGASSSPALKEDLRKRLSTAEEDEEDLSWDIEDDDDDDAGKH